MVPSCIYFFPVCLRTNLSRVQINTRKTIGSPVEGQTSVSIAPRPKRSIIFYTKRNIVTAFDIFPIIVQADADGCRSIYHCAVAQLSAVIKTPRPKGTIGFDKQIKIITRTHLLPIIGRTYQNGRAT